MALIINLQCRRNPLYLVEEFYQEQDLELLFGPGIEAEYFNDDALGKTKHHSITLSTGLSCKSARSTRRHISGRGSV